MDIFVRKNADYYEPIRYVLKIIEKNRNIRFSFIANPKEAQVIWDHENDKSEIINLDFYRKLRNNKNKLKHDSLFIKSPIITNGQENEDVIATIFYLINCIQEIDPSENELDQFERFKYTSSFQFKFGKIEENIVEQLIDTFCQSHTIKGIKKPSSFFISHDIDTIYGSFLQDGFWALKKMKIGVILNLIALELIRKPHWKNIDRIIKINNEYDVRSTFFWLVNKNKGTLGVMNADYKIKKEQHLLNLVLQSNNINGLHKSCSEMSINKELEKGAIKSTFNRYHFLNFLPHKDWKKISDSKLDFDCSLGFAEHYGFRNSYGKAFQPFDVDNNKPFDFVEAPLHFMDGTFNRYMGLPVKDVGNTIINFYEKNSENCDFSLLWHNTYFTDYKYNSFLEEYKKVLSFIYESKIKCLTPKDLIKENKLIW